MTDKVTIQIKDKKNKGLVLVKYSIDTKSHLPNKNKKRGRKNGKTQF